MAAGDIIRWISNSSTTWSTGANWTGGAAPAADEIALFDGQGQASVAGSDESATAALRAIIVETGYTGDIGSSGSPLEHNITTSTDLESRIVFRGQGDLYFKTGDTSGPGTNTQAYAAVIDAPGSTISLDGSQTYGGFLSELYVKNGNVTVATTCGINGGLVVYGPEADVTIQAIASTENEPIYIHVTAGLLTNNRATASNSKHLICEGGKVVQKGVLVDAMYVHISNGGWLDYQPNATLSSSHNPAVVCNGVLDLRSTYQKVQFDKFIRGPLAQILGGGAFQPATDPLSVSIDLREAYP